MKKIITLIFSIVLCANAYAGLITFDVESYSASGIHALIEVNDTDNNGIIDIDEFSAISGDFGAGYTRYTYSFNDNNALFQCHYELGQCVFKEAISSTILVSDKVDGYAISFRFMSPSSLFNIVDVGGFWVKFDAAQSRGTPSEVPEPSNLAIFALGMIGLAFRRFKKQS